MGYHGLHLIKGTKYYFKGILLSQDRRHPDKTKKKIH